MNRVAASLLRVLAFPFSLAFIEKLLRAEHAFLFSDYIWKKFPPWSHELAAGVGNAAAGNILAMTANPVYLLLGGIVIICGALAVFFYTKGERIRREAEAALKKAEAAKERLLKKAHVRTKPATSRTTAIEKRTSRKPSSSTGRNRKGGAKRDDK